MLTAASTARTAQAATPRKPRIGFLGVGWIGLHRMKAIMDTGLVDVSAIADSAESSRERAAQAAPQADLLDGLDGLLARDLDGLVIATPTALHAEQARAALDRGIAVFCQKPLGRTKEETHGVIEAARRADRLLAVDFSYRFTEAARQIRDLIAAGELGEIFAAELVFHNAYGPDKEWFYDRALSGGGCVTDLGVHLVDLALWMLDFPRVTTVDAHLFANGRGVGAEFDVVEDFGQATLRLETGTTVQLACSWRLHAGTDAVISASFHGTSGGAALRNVNGSFYDFVAERYRGTSRETLASPPDEWGGRAAADWARRLAAGAGYDPEVEHVLDVAGTIDRVYGR